MDWYGFDAGTPADFGGFNFTDTSFGIEPDSWGGGFGGWAGQAFDTPPALFEQPGFDFGSDWTDWNGGTSQPVAPVDATTVPFESDYPISWEEPISDWGQNVPPPSSMTPGFSVSGAVNAAGGLLDSFSRFFASANPRPAPQRTGNASSPGGQFAQTADALGSLTRNLLAVRANVRDTANRLDAAPRNINREVRRTMAMQDGRQPSNTLPGSMSPMMLAGIGVAAFAAFVLLRRA